MNLEGSPGFQKGGIRDFRTLTPRQADGQCLHRGVQWLAAGRIPVSKLVHEPARCPGKAGALAWRRQYGKTAQRFREQTPDHPLASPVRHREKAGKPQSAMVQTWVSEQNGSDSLNKRGTRGSQVISDATFYK